MVTSRLVTVEHRTVVTVTGPLLAADPLTGVGYAEPVEVTGPDGTTRRGQVLEIDGSRVTIQVLDGTHGLGLDRTTIRSRGETSRLAVGAGLLGRAFDGQGQPADGGPPVVPEAFRDINGAPLNPVARSNPSEFVETGISAIDGLATLVRGQKLPIFSGYGLPAAELAARIATSARVPGDSGGEGFVVVFAALGVTRREAGFYRTAFAASGRQERMVLFVNLADDPAIERLATPRLALTAAEYLAWDAGLHVLVVLTDMTSYCEALREISAARQELPGRRGFPSDMYSDLASIFERAGRVHGKPGSITQLAVLTMPDDDVSHPIPDLTGYITEGQVVLSRELDRRGIFPPIDVLPSLSRLMNAGIGAGSTRDDHRDVAGQLYACYARGRQVRDLASIVGTAALGEDDRRYLSFADDFEQRLLNQGTQRRPISATLDLAWDLLGRFPRHELTRIRQRFLDSRHRPAAEAGSSNGNARQPESNEAEHPRNSHHRNDTGLSPGQQHITAERITGPAG
jgi:V/A-type H+/Na+-transporting ATPase subunit B